ncbi:hypothetical protein M422DRAFT_126478, partial [Sphaerobolus stellatus SS14]
EYIWLDEFCLADAAHEDNAPEVQVERNMELRRLTDIFSAAAKVCVICHILNCDYTTPLCPWGQRLFTLGEIVHARDILPLEDGHRRIITKQRPVRGANRFREKIQTEAGKGRRWHLYSIMQHAGNSGSVPWQAAIQALIVEAINRDEAGGFINHGCLGKALNGLLPRRARVQDLRGENGWEDLAWLLELNQGFYNVTGLAAVCSVAQFSTPRYHWLGKPMSPKEGNERLELIVTSFPVCVQLNDDKIDSALFFLGPRTILLQQSMQRDGDTMFDKDELK